MELLNLTNLAVENASFAQKISAASGQPVQQCYQCGKCTAGCPVASYMDIVPNQVMRMIQLGIKDELLRCQTIWLCSHCSTCSARCPRNINLPEVMDNLRIMAKRQSVPVRGRGRLISIFHNNFLDSVSKNGRMYELGAMMNFNIQSRQPFKEALTGLTMLKRGKLKIRIQRPRGIKEISNIFKRVASNGGR